MVGNWLYGVAHQTALKARALLAKRRTRERQVEVPEPETPQQPARHDLQAVLDHELSLLPDYYRVAIVLCDLEGKTRKDVARQLGVPEGTLAGRLTRGRALLAKRLARHGLAVSGGALEICLSQEAVAASVPGSVMVSTIQVVSLVATGQAVTAGTISVKVAALTEGVLKTMLLQKLKMVMAGMLAFIATAGLGAGAVFLHAQGTDPTIDATARNEARQDSEPQGQREEPKPKPAVEQPKAEVKEDEERNPFKSLPPEILEAWNEVGADSYAPDRAIKMPALIFGFSGEQNRITRQPHGPGLLAKLPDPGRPFGLFLHGKWVTDAVMKELTKMKNLQLLRLGDTEVTDAGLKELAVLKNLRTLDLAFTKVTGTGLSHLTGLKDLQNLYLSDQVTDAGLKELAGLKSLQWLVLSPGIKDSQLQALAELRGC
jgi:hypothetical protein